jgi:hypothetical protein
MRNSHLQGELRHSLLARLANDFAVFACLICLPISALLGGGCMHYEPSSGLPFRRIYVAPVKNDSFAPQAQALLTKQLRIKLSKRPELELAESAENAALLEVELVGFDQSVATEMESDTACTKSLDVTLVAFFTLSDVQCGVVRYHIKDCKAVASIECHEGGSYRDAKYQSMPRLTDKLADKICDILCNLW